MNTFACRLYALVVALSFSASAWTYDLTGQWELKIENQSHHVVTSLGIEFTSQSAPSCISGNWRRVIVLSSVTENAHFYPASDPLSFSIENNHLTIGRNEICDGYLMLHGTINGEAAHGEYYGLGLGGTWPIGFFTMSRMK